MHIYIYIYHDVKVLENSMMSLDRITHGALMMFLRKERFERLEREREREEQKNPLISP